jgi:1-phosphofructokinase family hexose kinase
MIHTVTANPALDLTYRVKNIKFDDTTRAREVLRAAGGKGINVSRVAARLGHPTVAMGFVGGRSGQDIVDLLEAEGVRTWFSHLHKATRINAIIQDDSGQQIRISGPGASVTKAQVAHLEESIFDLRTPDFLLLSGSLPKGMPKHFYLTTAKKAILDGAKVIADADGEELKKAVEAGVYLIKPNQYELGRLTGVEIRSVDDVIKAAQQPLNQGVEVVICSLGPDGAVLVTKDEAWQAIPPVVKVDSAVGAGDSLVAGVLVAKAEGQPWDEILRLGVACGTATATTPGTSLCFADTIEEIKPRVRLQRLVL